MNWMLVVAMGLVAVTTLGVARIWGRAAGAAACAVLGTLCLPPVMLLGPGVLWEDVLIAAGLIGVLAWGSVRSTWPVRLQIADLFMLGLVALPPLSVVVNGQALDAAGVELLEMTTMWAVAYVAGRWLVRDPADLQRVALVVVLALAAYAPLCVIESMTRPALAERLFGLDGPNVTHTKMLGNFIGPRGYRPYVFTEPFFQLTMLQAAGIVLAAGLWLCRGARDRRGAVPWVALAGGVVLLATSIGAQRSWSAILLPLAALGLFGLLLLTRWRVWALVAICLVPAYFGLRATEVIPTAPLPLRHADGSEFLAGRARSINLRMSNEQAVFDAVRDKPLLGTGAAHRDASGNWIMADHWGVVSGGFATLLRSGYIGLGFLMLGVMAPAMLTLVRVPVTHWRRGAMPLMIGGAVALIAFAINLVPNHIESPTFALLAGALVTVSRRAGEQARAGGVPFALHADSDVERWAKICGVGAEAVTGPLANGPGPATSRTRT